MANLRPCVGVEPRLQLTHHSTTLRAVNDGNPSKPSWTDTPRSRHRLDPARVIATIETLELRIRERFPEATLIEVCEELRHVSVEAQRRASWVARPILGIRFAAALAIAVLIIGLTGTISQLEPSTRPFDLVLFVNVLEAGINNLVLLAVGAFFLVTIETRIKRRRSLDAIHELRSLAHIIDLHQLTKDPDRLLLHGKSTKSSPATDMDLFEMSRYLDYCCEMLSLLGKIAAIYGLHWRDTVSVQAVSDVERLTTGLSQKIFQKIMILHGSLDDDKPSKAS